MISFIFIFGSVGYSAPGRYALRLPLVFQKEELRQIKLASNNELEKLEGILNRLGIEDINSSHIAGVQITTWLREHRLFSCRPPISIASYLNWDDYYSFIKSARDRKFNEVRRYILNYGIELYQSEVNPGYQRLVSWLNSLKEAFARDKSRARQEGVKFKAKFVDYLNGRAGPHIERISIPRNNISPLEWAAQGKFFWQVHETRHGFLFGRIDISGRRIGDLPIFPLDGKGALDENMIQWMFQRDSIPPLEYYKANKVSLRELLRPKKEDDTSPVQLEFDFRDIGTSI